MLLDFPATYSMHFPNQCMEILSIKKTLLMKGNLREEQKRVLLFPLWRIAKDGEIRKT